MDIKQAEAQADAIGGAVLPAIVGLIVGVYRFIVSGVHWSAVVMVAGAVASFLAVGAYANSKGKQGQSWGLAAASASMLIPWAFSLYLIVYEGMWRAYQGATGGEAGSIFAGFFWIAAGWRMLFVLGRLQRATTY